MTTSVPFKVALPNYLKDGNYVFEGNAWPADQATLRDIANVALENVGPDGFTCTVAMTAMQAVRLRVLADVLDAQDKRRTRKQREFAKLYNEAKDRGLIRL